METHPIHETFTVSGEHYDSSRLAIIIKSRSEHMNLQGLINGLLPL